MKDVKSTELMKRLAEIGIFGCGINDIQHVRVTVNGDFYQDYYNVFDVNGYVIFKLSPELYISLGK